MGFKEDADFARYLTIGAYAAQAVAIDLDSRGHRIIELERYAMANKVWTIKVKRLRLPDLLCVDCGRRFESKGKSKLEIRLSHSSSAGREWYAGGMRLDDIYAFVQVAIDDGGSLSAKRPLYLSRRALEEALDTARRGARKAASEGSEVDVRWPAWVPNYSGTLIGRERDGRIAVLTREGRLRRYTPRWHSVYLYLQTGESFEEGSYAVAGVVRPAETRCPGQVWDPIGDLKSTDVITRYAAVKAIGSRPRDDAMPLVTAIAGENSEDWRVRYEAMAVCAAMQPAEYVPTLLAEVPATAPPERQMEAVFILTELDDDTAAEALAGIARSRDRPAEVRAAAAWGLGARSRVEAERIMEFVDDDDDRVALHAAASLPTRLPQAAVDRLLDWCRRGTLRQVAIAVQILARHNCVGELHQAYRDAVGEGRLYAARALGDLPPDHVRRALGSSLHPSLLEVLEVIWTERTNWVRAPENLDALDILDSQKIRGRR